ncbi:MAG TPA: porin [Ramlibacter sp.]|uniref:porin n=1 Tax=Ramlibacter sp. TaxID=1917967 RepID=UPI002ED2986B
MTRQLLVGLGLLAAASLTHAQTSSVSIYGMLDIGMRHLPDLAVSEDGITRVDDASRSRMGYRIKEDLGGGLSAFARLEHSLRVDTGQQRDPVKYFDDKSWVGLDHVAYGNIALGRLRSPIDEMTSGSRFEAFEGFSLAAAVGRAGRSDDAWDNGVYYITPSFNGFRAGVGGRFGEGTAHNARGVHAEYTKGPLDIGLAWQVDGETLSSTKTSWGGGMSWRFSAFSLFGTYVRTSDIGATNAGKAYTATLGVRVPAGPGEFRAAARKVDNDRIAGRTSHAGDVDTTHIGIGYHYPMSKRTSINASLVRQTRKTFAASGATATDRQGIGSELALRVYF